nr:ribonuclease H-like domain-containing protein [Tanacetum cinerariifolium]
IGDLYPVTAPSPIPHAFLESQHMWHQRLGHPGSNVLCRLVSNNIFSCNKEKPPILCHAFQLGKHVRLPFVSSNTIVSSCFDIVYSDVWISPIPSLSGLTVLLSVLLCTCLRSLPYPDPIVKRLMMSIGIILLRDEYNALIKNTDGTLSRYKARLVANGSTQLEGVDVDEPFSLVVKPGTIRTVLSLAASQHWPVHQLDCSLYGLKQALCAWFQRFVSYTTRVGFHHSRCDSFLVIFHQGKDTAYLLLYVDDIVLTATSLDLLHRIISSLHQEFALTDLGSFNYFLGISVIRDSSGMFLSQKKYTVEIFERPDMVHCNPSRTLVDTESKMGITGDVLFDPTLYRSLEGSLQYPTFTSPDIFYAVQHVCLHMHDPREPHFFALKRILSYVCGTLDYGLQLFSSSTTDLVAYSDADWAGYPTTKLSTSGYCVFLGNNLLSWSAKRQPTLSCSSAEAEYRGVANAVAETCWIRNLLRELHIPLSSATLVCCDNVSAVCLSSNLVQHQRTKHIEIDIHFVCDLVATGQVRVLHVPSRYEFAYIFTKSLPTALFEEFRSSFSVRCPPAQIAREC